MGKSHRVTAETWHVNNYFFESIHYRVIDVKEDGYIYPYILWRRSEKQCRKENMQGASWS